MGMAGFEICAGLGRFSGNSPFTDMPDWCDFPDGWEEFDATDLELRAEASCSCFGSRLTFTPIDGGLTRVGYRTTSRLDFTGGELYWRMRLPTGTAPFGFVNVFDGEAVTGDGQRTHIRFEPAGSRLDLFISGDTVDEYTRINSYSPDGSHAWMRMVHDADTDFLELQTAPFCGEWTTRLSATMDTPMSDMLVEVFQEVTDGSAAGWFGRMYTSQPSEEEEE